ncbi:disulfide bond formation protein B [Roseivivax sediminis]|uniref:Disulfide bond formation protein DsbB n=1 Tax=Roseivivax sediminis TaxID=936889 RepID=A0A1I1VDP9_9RHOB|nr:disulfide bond formation protein B [Roseivivax sediminis]SFD80999.1 Disulfide bond formation protein DsbB [Roseivivax sediminis]
MTRNALILIASAGSAALLLGALGFQHLGGLAPCKLCHWQRYPHGFAILLGLVATRISGAALSLLGTAAMLVTAGVGIYHTGVERGWWEGPSTCTSGAIDGLSTDQLMDQIMNAPLVRCDEVAWQLAGLSMASWNALLSLALAAVWIAAWRRDA